MPTVTLTTATTYTEAGIITTGTGMTEPSTTGLSTNDPATTGTTVIDAETIESTTDAETTTTDLGKYT